MNDTAGLQELMERRAEVSLNPLRVSVLTTALSLLLIIVVLTI